MKRQTYGFVVRMSNPAYIDYFTGKPRQEYCFRLQKKRTVPYWYMATADGTRWTDNKNLRLVFDDKRFARGFVKIWHKRQLKTDVDRHFKCVRVDQTPNYLMPVVKQCKKCGCRYDKRKSKKCPVCKIKKVKQQDDKELQLNW